MSQGRTYIGLDKDKHGGMNPTGNIIRDAWVFGLIPETETCEGWLQQGIDALYENVFNEWEKYGHMVSNLPDDLREKHKRIYDEAIKLARESGWNPELDESIDH